MLTVYHSNKPESFKNLLIHIMSEQSLSNPMQSEVIIIENKIMIEWIQIELAKYFGIAANLTFIGLTAFIKKISNTISSNNFVINDFNCSIIYWKFMEILPKICLMQDFSIIKKYLSDDFDKRKCGQFSEQLVKLFTKYLIYRPDWLDSWQSNKIVNKINDSHQLWQSELWRVLLKCLKNDNKIFYANVNYLQHCVNVLKNLQKIDNNYCFPKRIFIFGITSMPPIYWEILHLLSYHIDVYLWFINPYFRYNYSSFINKNLLNFTSLYRYPEYSIYAVQSHTSMIFDDKIIKNNIKIDISHVLNYRFLNFCDFTGKNTLLLLAKFENLLEKKFFVLPKEDSLLHILQKNILEFQNCVTIDKNECNIKILQNLQKRNLLSAEDQSITCHICYSMQREVEVLHDNLLLMVQRDPCLLTKGIVVMAPNIFDYKATIKTVFDNIYDRNLPFIISNNHEKYVHPIISAFLSILNILHSKCTSTEILSILKVSLISARFNIKEEEVQLLYQWTINSGIRWGLDDITIRNLNIPISDKNTWNAGLNRMLLGHAMHDQYGTWEDIFPFNGINEEHINVVGQLGEFLKVLQKWRNRFSNSHVLTKWVFYINEILDDFFCYSNITVEENRILFLLKDCWKNILESGIRSGYSQAIDIVVLRDKLFCKLKKNVVNCKFLPNVINFCDITPIFCVPCKIVCFLGMNENIFPRNDKVSFDFDLMKKFPRDSDHNLYQQDCYSFLLAFLLAKEKIYISYISNVTYNNTVNDSSILIHILFEYIARYFYLEKDKNLDINTNIDNIRNHLCRWHSAVPFATERFIFNNNKVQSFANEWVPSANIDIHTNNLFDFNFLTPLPQCIIHTISFYDLYNFYRHPIKMWFHRRLGVYFDRSKLKFSEYDDESFSLNMLNRFHLNIHLLDWLIHNKNINEFYSNICAAGILPHGVFGEFFWIKQYSKMAILANQIKKFYLSERISLKISLSFNDIKLNGQLTMIQKNGLVRWKPSYLSMKDSVLLWLEHLTYCASGGIGDSRLFGINDIWHFPNLSVLQAKEYLFLLVQGYLTGINTPLFLLYKSGEAWMKQVFNWNTKIISQDLSCRKKARCKLIHAWKGIKQYSLINGEYDDPYMRILMPYNLSEENIKIISKTAEYYFLFPMKYKIL